METDLKNVSVDRSALAVVLNYGYHLLQQEPDHQLSEALDQLTADLGQP